MTSHGPTLALTLLMAFVYLVVVRLVDLNEKEPLWAVGTLFGFGAIAGSVVRLVVAPSLLDFDLVSGVLFSDCFETKLNGTFGQRAEITSVEEEVVRRGIGQSRE